VVRGLKLLNALVSGRGSLILRLDALAAL